MCFWNAYKWTHLDVLLGLPVNSFDFPSVTSLKPGCPLTASHSGAVEFRVGGVVQESLATVCPCLAGAPIKMEEMWKWPPISHPL